jgi:predicted ATPase
MSEPKYPKIVDEYQRAFAVWRTLPFQTPEDAKTARDLGANNANRAAALAQFEQWDEALFEAYNTHSFAVAKGFPEVWGRFVELIAARGQ